MKYREFIEEFGPQGHWEQIGNEIPEHISLSLYDVIELLDDMRKLFPRLMMHGCATAIGQPFITLMGVGLYLQPFDDDNEDDIDPDDGQERLAW